MCSSAIRCGSLRPAREIVTVVGAGGFIGGQLVRELERRGTPHEAFLRGTSSAGRSLGTVVYCAGVTADFHRRTSDTVRAHVTDLHELLASADVDALVYLSSTRLYNRLTVGDESQTLQLRPDSPGDIYNLTKALGEALTLRLAARPLVVRLSNVYGPDLTSSAFLPTVLRQAVRDRHIVLEAAPASTKDYLSVSDLVTVLVTLVEKEASGIYNIASGFTRSHADVLQRIQDITGCTLEARGERVDTSPLISTAKLQGVVPHKPRDVLDDLPDLVKIYQTVV